uniref:Uncharacterized protein n=1 Tax=Panagrolaimus sp. PS1159 TaxID=55785 RepID=A0AC35G576_9BILA
MFSVSEIFVKPLPEDKEVEYRKIVNFLLNATTTAAIEEAKKKVDALIYQQRKYYRDRLNGAGGDAVAMSGNHKPVILMRAEDGLYEPVDHTVQFIRRNGVEVNEYPILRGSNGNAQDTLFAKKTVENNKTKWSYFVVTSNGVFIPGL